jgi:hypothetical protein
MDPSSNDESPIPLDGFSVYREFLSEREEILRHKWIESEKAGHDIGFDKALFDWVMRYRPRWVEQRRRQLPGAVSTM